MHTKKDFSNFFTLTLDETTTVLLLARASMSLSFNGFQLTEDFERLLVACFIGNASQPW